MTKIKEEDFWNIYKPQINQFERAKQPASVADEDVCSFNGCMFETYGEDEDYIFQLAQEGKLKNIWTILDVDGKLIIAAGLHKVNRFGFLVTEKEWTSELDEVEEN